MRRMLARLGATSIRIRLLVAYIGIILLGFSGLTVLAGGQITTAVRADYGQRLQNEIRLVAQGLVPSADAYNHGQIDENGLRAGYADYETQTGGKLTFYALADPQPGKPPSRQSFYNMPELETALRGGIIVVERPNDTGESTFYSAAPVIHNGHVEGLIQLAVPAQNLQGIVVQRWAVLGIGFALLTSLAIVAAFWLSRSIIQPLYKLRESAIRLSQGDFSHRVKPVGKDEIGAVAKAFNEMAAQVQSMLEEQRAFASNTSHELRTPLTAIQLRAEALRHDTTLDEETARRYVEEIDNEIAGLGNLVQDLTLLARFDAGRAELGNAQIDFVRLATNLCQQVSDQAKEKNVQVSLDAPTEPRLVNASLNHLTVVFRNVLDNALKYTPSGGKIAWCIKDVDCGTQHTVQDNGSGIAPQHLPHLFERFYRADKAHSRDIPGTGLGLSLVNSIVEAYGGRITIASEGVGKGTTVKVFWPDSPKAR
jgi:signal transduction histidine kinase